MLSELDPGGARGYTLHRNTVRAARKRPQQAQSAVTKHTSILLDTTTDAMTAQNDCLDVLSNSMLQKQVALLQKNCQCMLAYF